jgi:sugar lactone lactonase YvrE
VSAEAALFRGPAGIATAPGGAVLLADYQNHVVRRVENGVVSTVAGWGAFGFAGDGGPARDAQLNRPFGVAVGSGGRIAIADFGNDRVRAVDEGGFITTVAGGGTATPSTGAAATASALAGPAGVAFGPGGDLFVAEFGGHRVLRVDPDGGLTVVAGTGTAGDAGDGGPGSAAELRQPVAVLPDARGGCWIADFGNHRVRHVDAGGIVRAVAGTGEAGADGDGRPATLARLDGPAALALAPDGALLIADMGNHKIREVDPSGTMRTVAGSGRKGNAGDGGLAVAADLDSPVGLAILGSTGIVADFGNNRLRLLEP